MTVVSDAGTVFVPQKSSPRPTGPTPSASLAGLPRPPACPTQVWINPPKALDRSRPEKQIEGRRRPPIEW